MTRKSNKRKQPRKPRERVTPVSSNRFTAALAPAREYEARGDYRAAERSVREVLQRHPQLIEAYLSLARQLERQERFGEAVACLCEAIRRRPKANQPRLALAELYRNSGKYTEAVACLTDYLELEPRDVQARYLLGFTQLGARQVSEGVDNLKAALRVDPQHVAARFRLGQALHVLRQPEAAEEAFRHVLRLQPDHGPAWLGLGQVLMRAGDIAPARDSFARAIRINPALPDVSTALARSHRYTERDHEEVEYLVGLASRAASWPAVHADYNFAVGKIMDDLRRYDEAFRYYAEGNRLARKTKPVFDGRKFTAVVGRIIDTFSAQYFESRTNFGHESETPVFVVGMMRSGSTLVEQILASHPAVFGGDELPYVDQLAETLATAVGGSYPLCAPRMQREQSVSLADEYLRRLRVLNADAKRIVDKMPGNLFHLGFIASLFPRAKIVHCQREPMDVALSIYFQQFENGHEWAYNLVEIAEFYREYHRVMKHWRHTLPVKIFDVSYEDLIVNPEQVTRALVAHCDLPWSEECLNHAQTSRLVRSASNWQVRQPLYKSSVARWKNYESHLQELLVGLDEVRQSASGVAAHE